ncbi:MAG: hypothetical protein ACLP5H_10830 [Desulfomonilaceae bacterium]
MPEKDDVVKLAIDAMQEERRQLAKEVANLEEELKKKQERLHSLGTFIEHGRLLVGAEPEPVYRGLACPRFMYHLLS